MMHETVNRGYTAADLVKKYIELRDAREKLLDEFMEKKIKPIDQAMTALEGGAAELLRETGQTALKTEHGTAYTSTVLSVKCTDRSVFLSYVFEHRAEHFLTSHVQKEAVKEYMDENKGRAPPGVDVTTIQRVNFRRA